MSLYIGLMSGTSADAIDAAIIDTSDHDFKVVTSETFSLSEHLRSSIIRLYEPSNNEIDQLGELDNALGLRFAECVNQLLSKHHLSKESIVAIGSHGQTVRHRPNLPNGLAFTLQIGNPNIIAQKTGIVTISDFRRRDIACGGQGAPLTPAFHQFAFAHPQNNRAILNIGGIANLTYLPMSGPVIGFDTGPGNGLMDAWVSEHKQLKYDTNGLWARSGKSHEGLLKTLMSHSYLQKKPPKSTGREFFSLSWLFSQLTSFSDISATDIQATLLEFTAQSISLHIKQYCALGSEVFLCGGGAHNSTLTARLGELLANYPIDTTNTLGIPVDDVEAVTFAWLAMRTWNGLHGNLPDVTGANQEVILGGIYPA